MCLPSGSTPTFEPALLTASLVTTTRAFAGASLTVINAVIIFVRLAMRTRRRAFRCHRIRPVSRSKSSPARGGWRKAMRTGSRCGKPTPLSSSGGVPRGRPIAELAGAADGRAAAGAGARLEAAACERLCDPDTPTAATAPASVDGVAGRRGLAMHREHLDQGKPEDEPPDMREVGHAPAPAEGLGGIRRAEEHLL